MILDIIGVSLHLLGQGRISSRTQKAVSGLILTFACLSSVGYSIAWTLYHQGLHYWSLETSMSLSLTTKQELSRTYPT